MTQTRPAPKPATKKQPPKQQRLSEALKANLKRRKAASVSKQA